MNYADLKIGKMVQTVLRPLIISTATVSEVSLMQNLEYSKETFGIQYPLLIKTSSPVAEKHYYSELLTLYGETYRLCCEWFETATNNDRPYVEKWIRKHEQESSRINNILDSFFRDSSSSKSTINDDWDDFFGEPKKKVETLPKDGTVIGEGQYKGREDLTVVEIPEGVVYIGASAFANCRNLKGIIIPDSVNFIGAQAFSDCCNLENVQLSKSLNYIGAGAFMDCIQLQKISIPSGITVIPRFCFAGCTSLKEVEFPSDSLGVDYSELRVIMEYAFQDCDSLQSISMSCHRKLNAILRGAFLNCNSFAFQAINHDVITGNCGDSVFERNSLLLDKEAF